MEDKTFALLEKMYSEFLDFKSEMVGFKSEMKDFKSEMLSFKEETNKNFQRIEIKLDGEITPKLNALFDGYKANSEKLEEINDKVDNLQFDVNNLSMKVAHNDNRILEIKRDLRSVK